MQLGRKTVEVKKKKNTETTKEAWADWHERTGKEVEEFLWG